MGISQRSRSKKISLKILEQESKSLCLVARVVEKAHTLISVLTLGAIDDGKGSARSKVHNHLKEIIEGKTTSVYHHILGFNAEGEVTNST